MINLPRNLSSELTRVGLAVTLAATVAPLLGCGEAPSDLAETGSTTVEPTPQDLDTPVAQESRVVDKGLFIDGSLSCASIPDRTCPGVTLRMANQFLVVGDGSGRGVSVPLNPPPPVQELFTSGNGMRAGIDLNSISCRSSGGQQVIFTEEIQLRFNTETRLIAQSNGTALVSPPSPSSSISRTLIFTTFSCPSVAIGVVAAGFEPNVVQGRRRFLSAERVPDDQTLLDGTANFHILCETSLNLDSVVIERDRPRDLLSASGGQFVDGLSLSASERQLRCNAMCFNDCSVRFGADALGAQFCTDVCTPDCVSRAITNADLCPAPECNDGCSQPSDCGDVSRFSCTADCCFDTIILR